MMSSDLGLRSSDLTRESGRPWNWITKGDVLGNLGYHLNNLESSRKRLKGKGDDLNVSTLRTEKRFVDYKDLTSERSRDHRLLFQ